MHSLTAQIKKKALELGFCKVGIVPAIDVASHDGSSLKVAAAAWIYAGGAHHTGFSLSLTAEHLYDFADMAGIEFLRIDENTQVPAFRNELRWNDAYYLLNQRI